MRGALHFRLGWAVVIAAFLSVRAAAAEEPQTTPASPVTRVLVLPFESLSGAGADDAAQVRALPRGLAFDLSAASSISCAEGSEVAPDAEAAVAAGKAGSAGFVVWGTVQRVGERIRVTGQVLDVSTGSAVWHFKLTGTVDAWFDLQDAVTEQVRRRLIAATRRERDREHPRANAEPVEVPPVEVAAVEVLPVEVPVGKPLRVRPGTRAERVPDWAAPKAKRDRYGEFARRHDGRHPRWGWGYPYSGYGYGIHDGRCRNPYRSLRHRLGRYTYRGLPDHAAYPHYGPRGLGRFLGAVPLRWLYR